MALALLVLLQIACALMASVLSKLPAAGDPPPSRNLAALPENPAISIYGPGPAHESCGTCHHLGADRPPDAPTEYGCRLQADRTKVTWDACAAFVPAAPPGR
jgi:hypothetical protein